MRTQVRVRSGPGRLVIRLGPLRSGTYLNPDRFMQVAMAFWNSEILLLATAALVDCCACGAAGSP